MSSDLEPNSLTVKSDNRWYNVVAIRGKTKTLFYILVLFKKYSDFENLSVRLRSVGLSSHNVVLYYCLFCLNLILSLHFVSNVPKIPTFIVVMRKQFLNSLLHIATLR